MAPVDSDRIPWKAVAVVEFGLLVALGVGTAANNPGAFQSVWLPATLVTVAMAAVAGGLFYSRGWLIRSSEAGRFFAASLGFHLIVVLVLAFWSLPTVMDIIVTKLHEAEAASQPFDDNQHQSHDDGQQAWEKMADLKAADTAVDLVRRETEPINLPHEADRIEPTIPIELARLLPSDRVLYVPPAQPADVTEPQQAGDRRMASPMASVEMIDEPEPLVPRPPAPPDESNSARPIELARSAAESPAPAAAMDPAIDAPVLRPVDRNAKSPDDSPVPGEQEQATTSRPVADALRLVAELTDDNTAPIEPIEQATELPAEVKQELQLARATTSGRAPRFENLPAYSSPRSVLPEQSRPPVTSDAVPSEPAMPRIRRSVAAVALTEPADIEPVDIPATRTSSDELAAARMLSIELPRRDSAPARIEVATPREVAGPGRPDQPVRIGEAADRRFDVPPQFGPVVSRLNRPRAKARKVVYAADSVGLSEMFTLRQSDIRKQYIELFDGTPDSESAVNHGLLWLATHQNPDGSWSLNEFHKNCEGKHARCSGAGRTKSNTAATGLALLPFLAAGNTHQEGEYRKPVAAAVNWLSTTQKDNGDLLSPGDQQHIYSHSIATIALCEVYGMTGDEQLKPVVERSLDFLVKAQHAGTGGWRYKPNESADTSVVGWAMMALKSGEMAGIKPPPAAIDNVARWLARVEGNKPVGGLFGYRNANATPAMTAEGLLCLQFMGIDRNDPRMRAGADYLLKHLPEPKQSRTSYYWYYGTQMMYHMQGDYWDAWNNALRDHLVESQVNDGPLSGTWEVRDNHEKTGGRLYTTSIKLLMLEVYYRHLPLYEQLDD